MIVKFNVLCNIYKDIMLLKWCIECSYGFCKISGFLKVYGIKMV